jgi:hypothetical protein
MALPAKHDESEAEEQMVDFDPTPMMPVKSITQP